MKKDTHSEQGDEELSTSTEGESSEDVNADGDQSEDIDGQLLDGNDDLGVEADKHLDVGLDIDLSLWMLILCELCSVYDILKEIPMNFNEDSVNGIVSLGDAVGNRRGRGIADHDGRGSARKHVCLNGRCVCDPLGHTCRIARSAG